MWQKMRRQILDLPLIVPTQSQTSEAILSNMDDNYIRDSYHSLSIEGYRVTEGLIERVRSGEWNPKDDKIDADRKNALAARGYYPVIPTGQRECQDNPSRSQCRQYRRQRL